MLGNVYFIHALSSQYIKLYSGASPFGNYLMTVRTNKYLYRSYWWHWNQRIFQTIIWAYIYIISLPCLSFYGTLLKCRLYIKSSCSSITRTTKANYICLVTDIWVNFNCFSTIFTKPNNFCDLLVDPPDDIIIMLTQILYKRLATA